MVGQRLKPYLGRPVAKRAPGRKSNARDDKQGLLFQNYPRSEMRLMSRYSLPDIHFEV